MAQTQLRFVNAKHTILIAALIGVCTGMTPLSASHIAFGSLRMEPVFMVLGQSAATAAMQAIDADTAVQDLKFVDLKKRLLADQQVLVWTGSTR